MERNCQSLWPFSRFFSSPSVIKTIDDDKGKPTLTITARKLENRARPTFQNGPDVEKRPQVRARKHSIRFHWFTVARLEHLCPEMIFPLIFLFPPTISLTGNKRKLPGPKFGGRKRGWETGKTDGAGFSMLLMIGKSGLQLGCFSLKISFILFFHLRFSLSCCCRWAHRILVGARFSELAFDFFHRKNKMLSGIN